jgi:hypothetical protein
MYAARECGRCVPRSRAVSLLPTRGGVVRQALAAQAEASGLQPGHARGLERLLPRVWGLLQAATLLVVEAVVAWQSRRLPATGGGAGARACFIYAGEGAPRLLMMMMKRGLGRGSGGRPFRRVLVDGSYDGKTLVGLGLGLGLVSEWAVVRLQARWSPKPNAMNTIVRTQRSKANSQCQCRGRLTQRSDGSSCAPSPPPRCAGEDYLMSVGSDLAALEGSLFARTYLAQGVSPAAHPFTPARVFHPADPPPPSASDPLRVRMATTVLRRVWSRSTADLLRASLVSPGTPARSPHHHPRLC